MNRELMTRLKKASEYQKMAIRELLPGQASEHIKVIERELKMMLAETAARWMSEIRAEKAETADDSSDGKVKKVDIT